MPLIKLRELIEQNTVINSEKKYKKKDVMGMTVDKKIIPTKADVKEKELEKFIVVNENDFIYNPRTHGKRIGLGYNDLNRKFIISWNNIAFHVKESKKDILNPLFLYIFFNRNEWDKMACFDSWGSSTEVFSWDALCDMEIFLPDINIQNKYCTLYNNIKKLKKSMDESKDYLETTYISSLENLKKKYASVSIKDYIKKVGEKNKNNQIKLEQGITIDKEFIDPQRSNSDLSSRTIVRHGQIAYCTQLNNENIAIAYREGETCVVSPVYDVIEVIKKEELLDKYLFLWFQRKEFGRYMYWLSEGTSYEFLKYENLASIEIPIPPIDIQQDIINIFDAYKERIKISKKLDEILNNICPTLIAAAAGKGE